MRTLLKLTPLLLCLAGCGASAVTRGDDSAVPMPPSLTGPEDIEEIGVTIKSGAVYELDTQTGGDEQGARIATQAQSFEQSEIVRGESTNWTAVYRYKPKAGFVGRDSVEIDIITGVRSRAPTARKRIIITVTK